MFDGSAHHALSDLDGVTNTIARPEQAGTGAESVTFLAPTSEDLARIYETISAEVAAFAAFVEEQIVADAASHGDQAPTLGHPSAASELLANLRRWAANGDLDFFVVDLVGERLGMTRTGDTFAW